MWKLRKSSWFLFFGVMAFSCLDQPDCFRLNSDQIGVSFRVLGTNKADVIPLSGLTIDGINGVFYYDTTLSSLLIPLNYLANETGVTISGDKVSGSMLLKYLSQAQFVSDECGPRYLLSNLTIDQLSGFDSVRLVTNQVNNPPNINIEIYRCPTNNLVKFDFRQLYIAAPNRKTSQALSVDIDNIMAGYSGALFYQDTIVNTVILPVDLEMKQSNFNMNIKGELNTISLTYDTTYESRYNVCPATTYVSALAIASTDFDSVSIALVDTKKVDKPQDPATTNVLIFKCPQTNLMKVYFKIQKGESFVSAGVAFNEITTNFSTDKYYEDVTISTVELPINESALTAEYYFDFKVNEGEPVSIDTLRIEYTKLSKVIFPACGDQPVYNDILATSPNILLSGKILVPKDSLQFPSITNIEIIKN